jgi:hypothetical protein
MGVDNIRTTISESTMQSIEHSIIEARPFAQVPDLYAGLFQQAVEVAFQTPRDDYGFIPLTVQSRHDVNRHALSAAGA